MTIDPLAPIAPRFKAHAPTTLILKEKSISMTGDSATIKNEKGETMFKIDANIFSMSEKRGLVDAQGQLIGHLRKKKMPGLHHTVYIGTNDDEERVHIMHKGKLNPLKSEAEISIGGNVVGKASGNWRAKQFDITINGREAGKIARKTNLTSVVSDADTYHIEIQAGVDLAFMALLCEALDELFHDD